MKTRSQIAKSSLNFWQKRTVDGSPHAKPELDAAKALVQLKTAAVTKVFRPARTAAVWPSGRPRRSTAAVVNYSE